MRKSKKKLLIGIIAIIIIITIIGLILIKNIINSKGIEQANYAANGNSDSKLIAGYIKKGVTIGGIEGTLEILDTSDATATKSDILSGKTAYVNGNKVTGEYEPLNTSDATATAENISSGKTAYVNGVKITGNGTDVNNSYNNGYNSGYSNGYNDGKNSATLKTEQFTISFTYGSGGPFYTDVGHQIVALGNISIKYDMPGNGGISDISFSGNRIQAWTATGANTGTIIGMYFYY